VPARAGGASSSPTSGIFPLMRAAAPSERRRIGPERRRGVLLVRPGQLRQLHLSRAAGHASRRRNGIARPTLYRRAELRTVIEEHRQRR